MKFILPNSLNFNWIKWPLGKLFYFISKIFTNNVFSDMLINRQNEMWREEESAMHTAEVCESTVMEENLSPINWKCCSRWQRKLSNKLNAKFFSQSLGVNVANLYWYGTEPRDIPFHVLPNEYVIKTSSGDCSRQVLVMKNGKNLLTDFTMNNDDITTFFSNLKRDKKFTSSLIIAEEFLECQNGGGIPNDFKLWCFNEEVSYIQVINRLKKTQIWYTADWRMITDQINISCLIGDQMDKPNNLNEILATGRTLCKAYKSSFVRIDLYNTTKGVYFGEFTPIPWGGKSRKLYTVFANIHFGKLWVGKV